ncbi:MAG: hypothetical protein RLZ33_368 [Bacteroidota bacterium]|jgi:uncharacterized protein YdhG (YjbR/CyaY superfamily)
MNEIDHYISTFPSEVQERLELIRSTIRAAAPEAEEVISYKMPAYKLKGILVYFAGYKNHIGFYPGANGISHFQEEIKIYKNAKGSVQFPHTSPLPLDLVTKIVKFRRDENLTKKK